MSSPFTATYPTGGIPINGVDIPASAVLMAVYLFLGIIHAIFFFRLSKRTFIPQAMVMGFCFSRVVSLALRMAWTTHITDKNVAIAANVFINAGVLLLYIVNLIFLHHFTLQLFPSIPTRNTHPFNFIIRLYMFSIIPLLILVIVPGVQLFLSSDLNTISKDRTILRFAQIYLTVFVAIQVPWILGIWTKYILSRKKDYHSGLEIERRDFPTSTSIVNGNKLATNTNGKLPMNNALLTNNALPTITNNSLPSSAKEVTIRATIIFVVAVLLTWIQAIKIRQGFYTPSPTTATNPPWFLQKPVLYAGLFLSEILIVIVYAVGGIRMRFLKPLRGEGKMEGNEGNEVGKGGV